MLVIVAHQLIKTGKVQSLVLKNSDEQLRQNGNFGKAVGGGGVWGRGGARAKGLMDGGRGGERKGK